MSDKFNFHIPGTCGMTIVIEMLIVAMSDAQEHVHDQRGRKLVIYFAINSSNEGVRSFIGDSDKIPYTIGLLCEMRKTVYRARKYSAWVT